MCPKFREGNCEIAGIEPSKIECVNMDYCLSNNWEECRVYISEFFIHSDEKIAVT